MAFKVWIDAICIDQDNKTEKDGQIPLMLDIYSLEALTTIHLGHETEENVKVMRFINALTRPPWMNKTED
jgi:hypothetical protein